MKLEHVDDYEMLCDEYNCIDDYCASYNEKELFRISWWLAYENEYGEYDPDGFEW